MKNFLKFFTLLFLMFMLTSCQKKGPFTITYIVDDQVYESEQNSFSHDNNFALPRITSGKDGYLFDAWYENNQFTGKRHISTNSLPKKNVTLYVKWKIDDREIDSLLKPYSEINLEMSLNLPTRYKNFFVKYQSSKPEVLLNDGTLKRDYKPTSLNYKVIYTDLDTNETFEKDYVINVAGYKPLETGKIRSSYVYRSYDTFSDRHFDLLEIVNFSFISVGGDGNIIVGQTYYNDAKRLVPIANEKGVYALICVGPSAQWSNFTKSKEAINRFADGIVSLINDYGFDGVDIDWESPTLSETVQYYNLMKTLYEKVKANNPNHLVTSAIMAGSSYIPRYSFRQTLEYLDYVNLMTYTMVSEGGYYQNALYDSSTYHDPEAKAGRTIVGISIDRSVMGLTNAGVPKDKIIVGVPFYGIIQKKLNNSWVYTGESIAYHSLLNYIGSGDYIKRFDEIAKVPYLLNNDKDIFISFEDPGSIMVKGKYIKETGLAGMMYWEHHHDETMALLNALSNSLLNND